MPRARWFVVGFLVIAAVVGGMLNARGPFGDHPRIAYDQVFADYAARKVAQISQWRDQLEIVEVDGTVLRAAVPPDRDFTSDFAVARRTLHERLRLFAAARRVAWHHDPVASLPCRARSRPDLGHSDCAEPAGGARDPTRRQRAAGGVSGASSG